MDPIREILTLYKVVGETPLECIQRYREENPEYEETKMTYVGRLDPMAEGLLLVLAGNTKSKDELLTLDKTYEFEVLWGFGTDTYDTLGLVTSLGDTPTGLEKKMSGLISKILKKKMQAYPPYSSRTVDGKPLFEWARENKISEIDVPTRGIKIFSLEHVHPRWADSEEILKEIERRVSLVQGDFRQEEILASWRKALEEPGKFLISRFVADVSSGTYIRGLAQDMGKELGTSAIAYSIKRTRVGEYLL